MESLRGIGKKIIDNLPVTIARPLPGEFEGTIDPRDYGFGVIRDEPLTQREKDSRIAGLYQRTKDRTGVRIPALERFLIK